jgi:hypothetical protein
MPVRPQTKRSTELAWSPQPGPQQALVDCNIPEVFMGGARGGGKTDGVLGKWALKERHYKNHFNAVALRRTSVAFADAIERSREIYGPLGGKYNESRMTWRMPHGGRVAFGYLENVGDAMAYQGRNLTDIWIEEAGTYPDPAPIDRLFGTLRSTHDVPIQMILTGNPGGPGQHWLAQRYRLIPFPRGPQVFARGLPNGKQHQVAVIPAKIADNQILMQRDPSYIDRLQLVGGPQLVKAWLEGDFSTVEGQFFEMWSEARHVLRAVPLPDDWVRFRAMDWGSASPFCVGWYAVVQDEWKHPDGKSIPRGAIIKYREWYGSSDPATSDTGLKLTNLEIGQGIVKREKSDPKLSMAVLDPSCFAVDGGKPIAEQINDELLKAKLISFGKADNRRVSATGSHDKRGALSGWAEMRNRLIGTGGKPMLYFFDTCVASIRTIPRLQHDPMKAEDIDTESVDHAADETRCACMARPWLKGKTLEDKIKELPIDYTQKQEAVGATEFERNWKAYL